MSASVVYSRVASEGAAAPSRPVPAPCRPSRPAAPTRKQSLLACASFSGIPGGYIIVNYADRGPTEPFTAPPTFAKSLYAKYSPDTNDFGELVQNFEGESSDGR